MKFNIVIRVLSAFFLFTAGFSCSSPESEKVIRTHEFEPAGEPEVKPDTTVAEVPVASERIEKPEADPEAAPAPLHSPKSKSLPSLSTLKQVSPDLQAKRALNNDAMKVAQMKPEAFIAYMKTRIPYYRGKGIIKAENDMVRIQISEKAMKIETIKGEQTFMME